MSRKTTIDEKRPPCPNLRKMILCPRNPKHKMIKVQFRLYRELIAAIEYLTTKYLQPNILYNLICKSKQLVFGRSGSCGVLPAP